MHLFKNSFRTSFIKYFNFFLKKICVLTGTILKFHSIVYLLYSDHCTRGFREQFGLHGKSKQINKTTVEETGVEKLPAWQHICEEIEWTTTMHVALACSVVWQIKHISSQKWRIKRQCTGSRLSEHPTWWFSGF